VQCLQVSFFAVTVEFCILWFLLLNNVARFAAPAYGAYGAPLMPPAPYGAQPSYAPAATTTTAPAASAATAATAAQTNLIFDDPELSMVCSCASDLRSNIVTDLFALLTGGEESGAREIQI